MTTYKLLKRAAAELDAAAAKVEQLEKHLSTGTAKVTKTAAVQSAKIGQLAKQAADKLLANGLLSNAQNRDRFAAALTTHEGALAQLAKFASVIQPKRLGQVVVDQAQTAPDADSAWDTQARAILARQPR